MVRHLGSYHPGAVPGFQEGGRRGEHRRRGVRRARPRLPPWASIGAVPACGKLLREQRAVSCSVSNEQEDSVAGSDDNLRTFFELLRQLNVRLLEFQDDLATAVDEWIKQNPQVVQAGRAL